MESVMSRIEVDWRYAVLVARAMRLDRPRRLAQLTDVSAPTAKRFLEGRTDQMTARAAGSCARAIAREWESRNQPLLPE